MHHAAVIEAHDVTGPEPEGQLKPGVIRQRMEAPQRGVGLTHIGLRHIGEGPHRIKGTNGRHTVTTQRVDDGRRKPVINAGAAVKKHPASSAQHLVIIRAGRLKFFNERGAICQCRLSAVGLVDQAMQKLEAWRNFARG